MTAMARQVDEGGVDREFAARRYRAVRARTDALTEPLSPEDQTIQSMPDVSPTKWHRAHTSWFFETFLLFPFAPGYREFHPAYAYLYNSYYEGAGPRHPRPERGLLSRPAVADITRYRLHVDAAMLHLIATSGEAIWRRIAPLLDLGLNHEEQHQELILMDIKHVFSINPLEPTYAPPQRRIGSGTLPMEMIELDGGLCEIGHGGAGFAFDNEGPRHKIWLEAFRLATRLVTCGDYLAFISDGGYRRPELWLADGWATILRESWTAPLYWRAADDHWTIFTLGGRREVDPAEPVCHVSCYEADAFARWAGKRLPSEAEWEVAATRSGVTLAGNLLERGAYHPVPASADAARLAQMIGDVWEWTASAYAAYPGYRPPPGVIGEYNGKFMANQMVLRGGAAVTPQGHIRLSYRNFFPPGSRWAFGGIRLAEDI